MRKCSECEYGPYSCSDICDDCVSDPDTGWGGFTDHSIGVHFDSENEKDEYYERMKNSEEDE